MKKLFKLCLLSAMAYSILPAISVADEEDPATPCSSISSPASYSGSCSSAAEQYTMTIKAFRLRKEDGTFLTLAATESPFNFASASAGAEVGNYISNVQIPAGVYTAVSPIIDKDLVFAAAANLAGESPVTFSVSAFEENDEGPEGVVLQTTFSGKTFMSAPIISTGDGGSISAQTIRFTASGPSGSYFDLDIPAGANAIDTVGAAATYASSLNTTLSEIDTDGFNEDEGVANCRTTTVANGVSQDGSSAQAQIVDQTANRDDLNPGTDEVEGQSESSLDFIMSGGTYAGDQVVVDPEVTGFPLTVEDGDQIRFSLEITFDESANFQFTSGECVSADPGPMRVSLTATKL